MGMGKKIPDRFYWTRQVEDGETDEGKVVEVAKPIQLGQLVDVVRREGQPVAFRDLDEGRGTNRPLEVNVEFVGVVQSVWNAHNSI